MHSQPNRFGKTDARPAGIERGFALVVTLSLMILLTVIAVGLLTLSSISLRVSSQVEAMQTARANARLALMLAIGQLQKEIGPDSKISAPHDAGNPAGATPRWTAVYDAWKTDPANSRLTPDSRVPRFRSWLVSGTDGANVNALSMVSLVGSGSLGPNPAVGNLVSAPLVELAGPGRKGAIAWWTADESTKAKITAGAATDRFAAALNPLADAQSPSSIGSQAIPQLSAFEWKTGQRSSAISTGSVNLAAGLSGPGIGSLNHELSDLAKGNGLSPPSLPRSCSPSLGKRRIREMMKRKSSPVSVSFALPRLLRIKTSSLPHAVQRESGRSLVP